MMPVCREPVRRRKRSLRRGASRERRLEYQEDHRALVAALRARNATEATEAMRVHLARVADHLLGNAR
jgi:DNA-binding FadR family transcriptional regulator